MRPICKIGCISGNYAKKSTQFVPNWVFFAANQYSDGSQNQAFCGIEMVEVLKSTLSIPVQIFLKNPPHPGPTLSAHLFRSFMGKKIIHHPPRGKPRSSFSPNSQHFIVFTSYMMSAVSSFTNQFLFRCYYGKFKTCQNTFYHYKNKSNTFQKKTSELLCKMFT